MQLAGIPNLIRTVLIIVLVYYIVKYAMRLFMAAKVHRTANSQGAGRRAGDRREGDVTIEYLKKENPSGSRTRPDNADQVDFEEIED